MRASSESRSEQGSRPEPERVNSLRGWDSWACAGGGQDELIVAGGKFSWSGLKLAQAADPIRSIHHLPIPPSSPPFVLPSLGKG